MDNIKTWKAILIGLLFGLLSVGIIFLITRPPRGDAVQLRPPLTASPLVVHVTGAVVDPGLYTLAAGARVQDAIDAAGGILSTADLDEINLAASIADGDQVRIPLKNQANTEPQPKATSTDFPQKTDQESKTDQTQAGLININTASIPELESLPGIGPIKAEKIVAYRNEYGNFKQIEEIENVSGIGPVTFEKIKTLICVSDE
jgi:competence protein ComEA